MEVWLPWQIVYLTGASSGPTFFTRTIGRRAGGRVVVPEALRPYLNVDVIRSA